MKYTTLLLLLVVTSMSAQQFSWDNPILGIGVNDFTSTGSLTAELETKWNAEAPDNLHLRVNNLGAAGIVLADSEEGHTFRFNHMVSPVTVSAAIFGEDVSRATLQTSVIRIEINSFVLNRVGQITYGGTPIQTVVNGDTGTYEYTLDPGYYVVRLRVVGDDQFSSSRIVKTILVGEVPQ